MSETEELSAIHAKTSAILEKLYDDNGQPAELDDEFVQEYFTTVQGSLKLSVEEDIRAGVPAPRGPHTTVAKLSGSNKGLVDVLVSSKSEKSVVSKLQSGKFNVFLCETSLTKKIVKTLNGTSQRFGSDRGKGIYIMTSVKGIPNITIKTGKAVVTFIGLPNSVQGESGNGEWVKV